MTVQLSTDRSELVERTKGFMPADEGTALLRAAISVEVPGPFLEVGSYCGKSSVYLGTAAEQKNTVLFSLDHHRGSEENQAGWEHHDNEVVDTNTGRLDTLPFFRRSVEAAGLEDSVIALVGKSAPVGKAWATPLAEGKTKSSIYKLDADTFTTTGGFRTDDDDKPMLIKWEKVLEAKK